MIRIRRRQLTAVLIAGLLVAGCATPTAHHVGDPQAGLFFDTPWQWQPVEAAALAKAQAGWKDTQAGSYLLDTIVWQSVWGPGELTPAAAFGNQAPTQPIVIAFVRKLYQQEQAAIDADLPSALADLVLAVSGAAEGDGLQVVKQQQVSLGKLSGIRQVLSWDTDGATQTLTSVAIVNQAHDRLYWVIGRCADACSSNDLAQLENVISTMTVKEPKVG